jgi:hypothetical protein
MAPLHPEGPIRTSGACGDTKAFSDWPQGSDKLTAHWIMLFHAWPTCRQRLCDSFSKRPGLCWRRAPNHTENLESPVMPTVRSFIGLLSELYHCQLFFWCIREAAEYCLIQPPSLFQASCTQRLCRRAPDIGA